MKMNPIKSGVIRLKEIMCSLSRLIKPKMIKFLHPGIHLFFTCHVEKLKTIL